MIIVAKKLCSEYKDDIEDYQTVVKKIIILS